jgi:hypothetical protein
VRTVVCGSTVQQTNGRFKGGEEVANGIESRVFEDGRHKNILKRDGYWIGLLVGDHLLGCTGPIRG